ncbi:related to 6-hydroxy-d-nicotine oxidase [Cephalotrichum gorgonifer]|uniref:Related to 6-hydroxy-d-nicotine oxidase n=1 Tax=Cephalotrichum gorgonifer TaxID=2041049 RepID=A0AAE8N0I0_9PEZI|nr:related to 6-hydroxy-d-nicotine oxidase [Cephalotrichum gorgonifer]
MLPPAPIFLTTALLAASATLAVSTSTEAACDEIAAATPERVWSNRLSRTYYSEVNSYWSTTLRDAKPACLVLPQSAEEVAAAVRILNKYPDVQFAVKSGGHTPNERHSSVRDGVLISTRDLSGVTYDEETQIATVRPGGEWNDVIGPLDEQGVTVVGGRLGLVGVGGYLLQGGISFLSAQYGLAADSIVGWEMVAANGTILNIDASEEPELAVALRGSGSQFGIVTQFKIKAYPVAKVWGGTRIYDGGKASEIYSALHNFVPGNADDEKAAIILTDITAVGGTKLFLIFYFYDGPEPPTTGPFAQFLNIGSTLDTTSTQSYSALLKSNGESAELLQSRISFRTFTLPYVPDAPHMYSEISDKFTFLIKDILKSPLRLTSQCSIDFQPFPAIIGKHSQERGGNAMGIAGSDLDRILLEIQCSWLAGSDDEVFHDASRELVEWLAIKVPEWTKGVKYYLPYLMNDAAGDQNVTGTYQGYGKFKALQERMDPAGFFKKRGGGFVY